MPTSGIVVLPLGGAVMPDFSGSGNNAPQPVRYVSTASQTTNSPKVTGLVWQFDDTTDEHVMWSFILPSDYDPTAGGGTIRLKYRMASAVSGNVVWKGAACCVTDSSSDDRAGQFDTVVTATDAAPATLGQAREVQLSLTMANALANRKITVMLGRDANNASDTATGDAVLVGASFEYTTV